MTRSNHQIKFKSSRKHHIKYLNSDRIRNFVVEFEIKFLIINIRNIFFVRVFFEYSIYFLSEAIVFSHQFDNLNIKSKNRSILYLKIVYLYISIWYWNHSFSSRTFRNHIYWFSSIHLTLQYLWWSQYQLFKNFRFNLHSFDRTRIIYLFREFFRILSILLANRSSSFIHSINSISRLKIFKFFHNISSNNQHWSYSSYSRVNSRTYLLTFINRSLSLVTEIVTIIEFENRLALQQNLQNRSSSISIRAIRFVRKFSRITSIDSANQSRLFKICDEIDNISNSNLKSIFQNFHIFVQYFDKNSVLKSFVFFENIAKSYLFH